MAAKFLIDGVDVTAYVMVNPTPKVTLKQNERSLASFQLNHLIAPPTQYKEVLFYDVDGVTPRYGGLILTCRTAGIESGAALFNTFVSCTDFVTYMDWCFWTRTYTSDVTLKQLITDLIADKLSAYGISLDAAQDNGPTFHPTADAPLVFTDAKASDALRTIVGMCDPVRVFRLSPLKALRVLVPGADAAALAITDANQHCQSLEWANSEFTPANSIILHCGAPGGGTVVLTEYFTATGSATSWVLETLGATFITHLDVDGTSYTVSDPSFHPSEYTFDPVSQTIAVGDTAPTPTAGQLITVQYTANLPFTVRRASGATPVIEYVGNSELTLDVPSALLIADGLLTKLEQSPRTITVKTLENIGIPAQALPVQCTARSIASSTFTIVSATLEFTQFKTAGVIGPRLWNTTLTATETTVYQGSTLDLARSIFGISASGAVSIAGGGGTPTTVLEAPLLLGGSREASVPMTSPPVLTEIINWTVFDAEGSFAATVKAEIKTRTPGVGVTLKLQQVGGSTQDSSLYTPGATSWLAVSFPVTIANGESYLLKVITDTNDEGVYVATPTLRAA